MGKQRHYPSGKLCEHDEGALAVGMYVKKNVVIIEFGRELTWIGLGKAEAVSFAAMLIAHANTLKITENPNAH